MGDLQKIKGEAEESTSWKIEDRQRANHKNQAIKLHKGVGKMRLNFDEVDKKGPEIYCPVSS